MNPSQIPSQDQITIQFNGQMSISRESLKLLLAEIRPEIPPNFPIIPPKINWPENSKNKRRAYLLTETAEILGISTKSVRRLIERGLLKNSKALRKIIIPASEIERFLKETL